MPPVLKNAEFRKKYARALEDPFARHLRATLGTDDLKLTDFHERIMEWSVAKDEHRTKYGFAVLDERVVEALHPLAPLLEVGAGIGYWAYELRQAGIDIVATEPFLGKSNHYPFSQSPPWLPLEPLTAIEAIRKYPDRNLLTIWPDYDAKWTGEMLRYFKAEFVIYVGEGSGGCTGDSYFHNHLDTYFDEYLTVDIPQFNYIHDRLYIYRRKSGESI